MDLENIGVLRDFHLYEWDLEREKKIWVASSLKFQSTFNQKKKSQYSRSFDIINICCSILSKEHIVHELAPSRNSRKEKQARIRCS